jgi:hypothetical protein
MAKQLPRIHSLSTVGIQHHFHADYLFHNFRTDFSGDSGVGKSMIADMLQLIFVGSEFLSATEGTGERPANKMPIGRYGYVFINVEVEACKYIVLGMFISTATINPDPFIIQGGYGKDAYTPLQSPISFRDILNGEIVEDIDAVSRRLEGQFNCQRVTQKAYHDYLMEHDLLPIQITDKTRLKNYARILRSFARGRDFKHDSESLKYFFFDDKKETEIHEDFQKRLDNIEADLDGHRRHKEILQNVSAKEQDLIKLKSLKEEKHKAEIELYKSKSIYHFRNIQNKEKEISDNQKKIEKAIGCIAYIRISRLKEETGKIDFLFNEIHSHLDTIQNADKKLKEIEDANKILNAKLDEISRECSQYNLIEESTESNIINHIERLYGEIETAGHWVDKYQTVEKVKTTFYAQQENNEKRGKIKALEKAINAQKLMPIFLSSNWILDDDIEDIYQQKIEKIDNEIKKQKALSKFADTSNPYSLSNWALKNRKALSREQESVLVHFKDLTMQKPELFNDDAKYLPVPEELFYHLNSENESHDGFWIKLNGIHEYISYVKIQIFDTDDTKQIEKYFAEYYSKSQNELERLEKEKKDITALKSVLNNIGNESVKAYSEKESVENYKIDKDLDKTKGEFESYWMHYFHAEDIKKWKLEIDGYLTTINQSGQIKKQINKDLEGIAKFLRQDKLQTELNTSELRNALSKLENEKIQEKKIFEHQFHWYLKLTDTPSSNPDSESVKLAERKVAKQTIFRIKEELRTEKIEYSKYLLKYENLSNGRLNIILDKYQNHYLNPNDEDSALNKITESYRIHYDNIVEKHVHSSSQIRFKGSEDFIALSKEILPDILTRRIINDEIDVLQQIKEYLTEITDKYTEFSDVKLNILKEIFSEVRDRSIEYLTEIAEISNYFLRNGQISQGISLNIKHNYSDAYPIEWIDNFVTRLEEKATYTDLFASLGEKISIEEMMREAYLQCGGKARRIDVKYLLNPKSYFNIDFSMRKNDGTINSGSTGQTYAAIALLCIARLSLIEKKVTGGRLAKGLRIMPIDETENIGSNFKMLEEIAQESDYQLVVISRHPLDDSSEKGRYQYMLNGQVDGGRIGTFAIFNEEEDATEYASPILSSTQNE